MSKATVTVFNALSSSSSNRKITKLAALLGLELKHSDDASIRDVVDTSLAARDVDGTTVFGEQAILLYLARKYRPALLGKSAAQEAAVLRWLDWSVSTPDALEKEKNMAFVYTEVQLSVPFGSAPWKDFNDLILGHQPGFVSKTWLSGLQNNSVGGFYAFDSVDSAKLFAFDVFPVEAKKMGAAFTTRVFPAAVAEEASRQVLSPFWTSDNVTDKLDALERYLADRKWLTLDEISLADVAVFPAVKEWESRISKDEYPHLVQWLARV